MGFKLKSGNTSAFKMMGSSPAKINDGPNLSPKLLKLKAERVAASNAGKIIKFGEGSNIIPDAHDSVSKNFNTKGNKSTVGKTPGHSTTKMAKTAKNVPKAIEGRHYPDKATVQKLKKGPYAKGGQNAQTKIAESYTRVSKTGTPKGFTKQQKVLSKIDKVTKGKFNKQVVKAGSSKLANTKITKQVVKNVAKKALKGAGRLAGGLGLASMAYDAYKSGQKHSGGKAVKGQKSFMADAKKNTKSIYKK